MLARSLDAYAGRDDVIVLALPRGGVPVGFEVAVALGVVLDVFVVRKLGLPGREELAMGAVATGGVRVVNRHVVRMYGVSESQIESAARTERVELERRERAYRGGRSFPEIAGRTVILVDDGLATGTTMRAAITALRSMKPSRIVVAVPAAPDDTCAEFNREVDEVVCLMTPEPFWAVGSWYDDFTQTTDAGVKELLDRAAKAGGTPGRPSLVGVNSEGAKKDAK